MSRFKTKPPVCKFCDNYICGEYRKYKGYLLCITCYEGLMQRRKEENGRDDTPKV